MKDRLHAAEACLKSLLSAMTVPPTIPSTYSPTLRLAQWIANVPRNRISQAFPEAVEAVRDLISCLIPGVSEPAPLLAARYALAQGPGTCSIIGHPSTSAVTAPWAAFANAAASHVLDFDDSFTPLLGHVSCTILPAVLAVAEEHDLRGSDVLDAFVVGVEIVGSIGRTHPKHYDNGWHSTATIGVIGTAAAVARLLRLSTDQVAVALSLAVSTASGSRLQIGTAAKCFQPAFAARDGVIAAQLAQMGMQANHEALTGPFGFAALYGTSQFGDAVAEMYTLPGVDEPLAMQEPGLMYKIYPICGSAHRSLNALSDMQRQHGFTAGEITAIETTIPFSNTRNLRFPRPSNGTEGRFSMEYNMALLALHGKTALSDYTDDAVVRPDVRALSDKVVMRALPGTEGTSKTYLELPVHTTVRLADGRIYKDTRCHRRGDKMNPLTAKEWNDKWVDCLSTGGVRPERAEEILQHVNGLAEAPDLIAVFQALPNEADGVPLK